MTRPTKTTPEAYLLRMTDASGAVRYRGPFASKAAAQGVATEARSRFASMARLAANYPDSYPNGAPVPPTMVVLRATGFEEVGA